MPPDKKIPAEAGIAKSGRRYRDGAVPARLHQKLKLPVNEAERPAPTVA